jgi:ESX-1-secreted protein regulator
LSASDDQDQRLSQRLRHLYETVPGFSDDRVAQALSEHGVNVSPQYIQQLRTGARTNPTLNIVYGLAKVFGVPATYLIGDDEEAERVDDQLAFLVAMKRAGVSAIALRAAPLNSEQLRWLKEQVERERRRAGIPDDDGG